MFSRTWFECLMCTALLFTAIKYQGTLGICTCVFSLKGKTYNITSLESKDDTARFTVEHQGYMYSYNPCRSFHFAKAPSLGDCQDDLAMCWWLEGRMYRKIAEQSTVECGFYKKIPMLQYTGDGYIQKTTVLLKCNKTKEKPDFEVVKLKGSGEYVFKLTHKCACPNACVISPSGHSTKKPTATAVPTEKPTSEDPAPTTTDAPGNQDIVVVTVVASVAGFLGVVILPIVIWQLLCKQNDNERQPLLDRNNEDVGVIDESDNRFSSPSEGSELTSGRGSARLTKPSSAGSSCRDITEPNKDNLSSTIKKYAEGLC